MVAPTCTQTGLETGTCECGATTTRVIPTIAHNYVDNICSACGRYYIQIEKIS